MEEEECCLHFLTLLWIVWWHSKGRPHAVPKRFKEKLVGLSHLLTIEICNENEWLIPDVCGKFVFFSITKANFWLLFGLTYSQLQAEKPQHACSHYTLPVFWDFCWYHTANVQATHAKHTRRANASLLEQQWRGTCEANATRIRGSPVIIEQINTRATISRVAFGVNRPLVVIQCNILTIEALLRKNMYLFLERCRKSNNVWLRVLMQSGCLYSSSFFERYNRILLYDWVLGRYSVCSFESVSCHNTFVLYLALTSLGLSVLLRK